MGGRRKARGFYMNKLPRQIPSRKPNEELPKVPLTADGIKRLGGIDWATRKVSRLIGYKVEIYETENAITEDGIQETFKVLAIDELRQ